MKRLDKSLLLLLLLILGIVQSALSGAGPWPLQEVEATGLGLTAEEAYNRAIVDAVRQVVGSFVFSETVVANDQLTKEQIETVSRGFIQRVLWQEKVKQEDGSWKARLLCIVRRERAHVQPASTPGATIKFDGLSIVADAASQTVHREASRKAIARSVRNLLREYPLLYKFSSKPPVPLKAGPVTSSVSISYTCKVDRSRYLDELLPPLLGAFEAACEDNFSTTNTRLRDVTPRATLSQQELEKTLSADVRRDLRKVREWHEHGWQVVTIETRDGFSKFAVEAEVLKGCDIRELFDDRLSTSCLFRHSAAFVLFESMDSPIPKFIHKAQLANRPRGDSIVTNPGNGDWPDGGEIIVEVPTKALPEIKRIQIRLGLMVCDFVRFGEEYAGFFDDTQQKSFCDDGWLIWGRQLTIEEKITPQIVAAGKHSEPVFYLGHDFW